MNKELKELSENFASLCDNLKQLKADMPVDPKNPNNDMMNKCMDAMYNIASNLHQRMDMISQGNWQWQDNHTKGHAPAFKSQAQLSKFLKNHDMQADYKAEPRDIYASTDRYGNPQFEVDLIKPK